MNAPAFLLSVLPLLPTMNLLLCSAFAASLVLLTFPAISAAEDKPAVKDATAAKPQDASKMNKEDLKKTLTPMQYKVACEGGTEPPFQNAFWNHKEPGIYVDIISGEPLFASVHKFDSGTGWPSFTQSLRKEAIVEKKDASHGMIRTEVRSGKADAHLGHVFDDGPQPTGLRYCINSASLRFVPVDKLEEGGYGEFLPLFKDEAKK